VITGLAALLASLPVVADGWETGGHLKYQYTLTDFRDSDIASVYGSNPANDHALDARLKADWRGRGWDLSIHYEILGVAGDSLATRRAWAAAGLPLRGTVTGLPDDRTRLLDLTDDFIDENRSAAVHRLDRLAVGYTNGTATLRLGRQAVSWGNGLAFQVMDFVNPFSPIAIDKDYKTGEDMLYGQWQWGAAGDVQGMALPRRDPLTRQLDAEQASYALKGHIRTTALELDLLAARHYDQDLLSVGLVRSVGGAVWRTDVLHTELPDRRGEWSYLTNLDYSWVLFGKNMYGFVEYFRNAFGASRNEAYLTPDPELLKRLARGELYTLARDYTALGLQVEWTPLVNVFATAIGNLNDGSKLLQLRGVWDIRQNLVGQVGATVPIGNRGTEYGGVPVTPTGLTLGPGRSLYARVAYYF